MTDLPGINNRVLTEAKSWIGTKYIHQASLKGVGTDCIGLIVGIALQMYGRLPRSFEMPAYTPLWAEESGIELMVNYGEKYLEEVPLDEVVPGDIIMYRMIYNGPTKHAAILAEDNQLIHAYYPHGVTLTPTIESSQSQRTHAFRFPVELPEGE